MDVLGEVRRAKRILNRVQAYLEQREAANKRGAAKRAEGLRQMQEINAKRIEREIQDAADLAVLRKDHDAELQP